MKKCFLVFSFIFNTLLYSNNINSYIITTKTDCNINNVDYYLNNPILSQIFIKRENYFLSLELNKIIDTLLNNKYFKKNSNITELGNTSVLTTNLLDRLKIFLTGLDPYSNTSFLYTRRPAGLIKLTNDCYQNEIEKDAAFISNKTLNQINISINDTVIMSYHKKIENLLNKINSYHSVDRESLLKIYGYLENILSLYIKNLELSHNCPLIKNFNNKIKKDLYLKYRIPAKTSILNSLAIFYKYIKKNEKLYSDI